MSTLIPRGNIANLYAVQVTINPANIATATNVEADVTVTGVRAGDIVVSVNKPSRTANFGIANARVKATNTVSLTFFAQATDVDAGSETYTLLIARPSGTLGAVYNV